jgi:hypothetical protein
MGEGLTMTFKKRVGHFVWELHDQYRAALGRV